jgi:sulfur-carrier protein
MQVNIVLFGRLTDITGRNTFAVQDVHNTDQLVQQLQRLYPAFVQAPYIIAVEKQIIHQNTDLTDNNTVALLPPYSGG